MLYADAVDVVREHQSSTLLETLYFNWTLQTSSHQISRAELSCFIIMEGSEAEQGYDGPKENHCLHVAHLLKKQNTKGR